MTDAPQPEKPRDEGIVERTPENPQTEAAHILANDAKDQLEPHGFSNDEITRWADTYVAAGGSGGTDEFIAWVKEKQQP